MFNFVNFISIRSFKKDYLTCSTTRLVLCSCLDLSHVFSKKCTVANSYFHVKKFPLSLFSSWVVRAELKNTEAVCKEEIAIDVLRIELLNFCFEDQFFILKMRSPLV